MSQPAQLQSAFGTSLFDLSSILKPVDTAGFLESDYGQRFRHVRGTPDKFAALLPWPVLNRILEEHRLEPPRLRLTREGKPVPPERYVSFQANRRKSGNPIPRVKAAALTAELREGATLVLDAVDELHQPIRDLAESLERVFRVRVQVNAYAGWRTSHGFDLHWDGHDVFVLQIAGRKHWQIYGTTRLYPLAKDVEPATEPPPNPVWDEMLEAGDLLYIPRGWWHVAMPLDEPTLHLTVGINNPTGADLLAWFTDRLRSSEDVRRDIPHVSGPGSKQEYARRLQEAILSYWHDGLVDEFLDELDGKSSPRPHFDLPWAASPAVLPEDGWTVRWAGSRRNRIETDQDGQVAISTHGRRWRFAAAAAPVLELLLSGRPCSLLQLQEVAPGLARTEIRSFVKELVSSGLVTLV